MRRASSATQQGELGRQQGKVSEAQGRISEAQGRLIERQSDLAIQQAEVNLQAARAKSPSDRREVEQKQADVDKKMRQLSDEMASLGRQMNDAGAPMPRSQRPDGRAQPANERPSASAWKTRRRTPSPPSPRSSGALWSRARPNSSSSRSLDQRISRAPARGKSLSLCGWAAPAAPRPGDARSSSVVRALHLHLCGSGGCCHATCLGAGIADRDEPLRRRARRRRRIALNAFEPSVKTELTIPTEVIVGTCILKAGVYIVACDREIVTFTLKSTNERMAEFECKGPVMKDKAKETRAVYEKQPSGYIVLEKLYLKGNNIEHIF